MRLRCPRFTVRRLMIVVAIIGIGLGMEGLRRRLSTVSARHHWTAMACRLNAAICEADANDAEAERELFKAFPQIVADNPSRLIDAETVARSRRTAAYYQELERKYDRAARYPWVHVEPDPPPPTFP